MSEGATHSCSDLLQTLSSSSSSSEQQRAAAAALLALPMTPLTWIIAVGAIPALVQMLAQPAVATAVQQRRMRVLRHISSHTNADKGAVQAASDSVIAALVPLLWHSREDVVGMVTTTISSLAFNPDNQRWLLEAGAIAPLVQRLKSGSIMVSVPAAIALAYLSANATSACTPAEIIAAGAVAPLVQLLKSSSQMVQYPATMVLKALCYDVEHTDEVAAAGVIAPLVQLLASPSAEMKAEALQALGYLACNKDLIDPIVAAGAIPLITQLLTSTAAPVQKHAAAALTNLAYGRDIQLEILAVDAITPSYAC